MFLLTLIFGSSDTAWSFTFRTEAAALAARESLETTGEISDDFGKSAVFHAPPFAALLDNIALSNEALLEQNLIHARLQVNLQQRLQSDPAMRAAMAMQQMHSPLVMPGRA